MINKTYIISVLSGAMLFGLTLSAQTLYVNGSTIYSNNGGVIYVNGTVQNEDGIIEIDNTSSNPAELIIEENFINNDIAGGDGNYRIYGDWINNSTFNAGLGTVFIEGNDQLLSGTASTSFYNLNLDGTGTKTQTIDQYCNGILNLNNIELKTETYVFHMQNTNANAIIRESGYVSSLNNGYLARNTNLSDTYLFPVGSSLLTYRYRPVEITPTDASDNTYTVRLANIDATDEGNDVSLYEEEICEVNPLFYHQINRSIGSSVADIDIFYDNTDDGYWDGISNWSDSDTEWSIITGSTSTEDTPMYIATALDWNNFTQIEYALFKIMPNPIITLEDEYCVCDDPTTLLATPDVGIWAGTGITNTATGEFDPAIAGPGEHSIIYTVTYGACTNSDSIIIIVNDDISDLLIPNVLTPNGDSHNDTWAIQGVRKYDAVIINIFDRWGNEIFTFSGTGELYEDPVHQWDGTYKDKDVPMGNYVYVVSLDGEQVFKNTLTVIR